MAEPWLPGAPEPDCAEGRSPWQPPGLTAVEGLAWVVVDELDPAVAGLVVGPWPRVDERGRLRFDPDRDRRLAVDLAALRRLLTRRVPLAPAADEDARLRLRERPPAIGDVFAARLARVPERDVDEPSDPADWLTGEIVDVTAAAREAAKAQASATLAGVLSVADVEAIAAEHAEAGD